MARKPPLRVVADDSEPPEPKKQRTVKDAAGSGDHREFLASLRARLAMAVDNPNTPAAALAALSRQLRDVVDEIEAMDAQSNAADPVASAAEVPDEKWAAT